MVGTEIAEWSTEAPLIAFVSVLAASLGVPVPTFAALIFVGALLAKWHGGVELPAAVFLAAMVGAAIGDLTWFTLGRKYGGKILRLLCRISLSRDSCIRQTTDFFAHQGMKLFLVARFIPGLSTVGAPLAGATGIRLTRFYVYTALGAALWIITGLALGFLLADQVGMVMHHLRSIGLDLGGVAVVLTLAYVGYSLFRRHRLLRRLRMTRISADDLADMFAAGPTPVIVDVRSMTQRTEDPFLIPGALLWYDLKDATARPDLSRSGPVVIYCACPNEISAASIAQQMRKIGFTNVHPLLGGLDAWRAIGQPITPLVLSEDETHDSNRLVTQAL